MRNGRKSRRLSYRAIEDNEVDRTFYHDAISKDPLGFPLSHSEAFRPQSRHLTDPHFDQLKKAMLAVVVCITGGELSGVQQIHNSEEMGSSLPTSSVTKDAGIQEVSVPIGFLILTAAEPEQYQHRHTTLGIFIIDTYQGNGYGPEAVDWALDWAFRFAGMHRVGLGCYGYNDRARRMYEKLGFVKEGTVREKLWFDRAWHDEIQHGMLESEWEKLRPP